MKLKEEKMEIKSGKQTDKEVSRKSKFPLIMVGIHDYKSICVTQF